MRLFWPQSQPAARHRGQSRLYLYGVLVGCDALVTCITGELPQAPSSPGAPSPGVMGTSDQQQPVGLIGCWDRHLAEDNSKEQWTPKDRPAIFLHCLGLASANRTPLPTCIQIWLIQAPSKPAEGGLVQMVLYNPWDWVHVPHGLPPASRVSFTTSLTCLAQHHFSSCRARHYTSCCQVSLQWKHPAFATAGGACRCSSCCRPAKQQTQQQLGASNSSQQHASAAGLLQQQQQQQPAVGADGMKHCSQKQQRRPKAEATAASPGEQQASGTSTTRSQKRRQAQHKAQVLYVQDNSSSTAQQTPINITPSSTQGAEGQTTQGGVPSTEQSPAVDSTDPTFAEAIMYAALHPIPQLLSGSFQPEPSMKPGYIDFMIQPAPTPVPDSSHIKPCLKVPRSLLLVCAAVQRVLGWYLAWQLACNWRTCVYAVQQAAALAASVATEQVNWFMTAKPAGIKLHAELCQLLGQLSLTWIVYLTRFARACNPWMLHAALALLLAACVFAGAAGACGMARTLLLLAATPLALLHAAASLLYRTQLNCLHASWRMMRSTYRRSKAGQHTGPTAFQALWQQLLAGFHNGNAQPTSSRPASTPDVGHVISSSLVQPTGKGPQQQQQQQQCLQEANGGHNSGSRQQSAGSSQSKQSLWGAPKKAQHEVVIEELFVGVLLFVPLLLLLPTTLAWHLLICTAHLGVLAIAAVLHGCVGMLQVNPVVVLLCRLLRPRTFPSTLALDSTPLRCKGKDVQMKVTQHVWAQPIRPQQQQAPTVSTLMAASRTDDTEAPIIIKFPTTSPPQADPASPTSAVPDMGTATAAACNTSAAMDSNGSGRASRDGSSKGGGARRRRVWHKHKEQQPAVAGDGAAACAAPGGLAAVSENLAAALQTLLQEMSAKASASEMAASGAPAQGMGESSGIAVSPATAPGSNTQGVPLTLRLCRVWRMPLPVGILWQRWAACVGGWCGQHIRYHELLRAAHIADSSTRASMEQTLTKEATRQHDSHSQQGLAEAHSGAGAQASGSNIMAAANAGIAAADAAFGLMAGLVGELPTGSQPGHNARMPSKHTRFRTLSAWDIIKDALTGHALLPDQWVLLD